ncbi:hypothetical protein TRIATDRAFT_86496 [Trichoderma atroviride IMI 206040]|uniref:Uncharacterized protein n=1 Tax=Hypocrea atroviridis (strain ATCC 20476 / IMI 206040) TaxID=452589 RepID=G9P237_HYPAI|nr:uncharacterized protein TRIATDRAFT_86496 [Trichoderma atroviride IMI 206040]EHK42632.1 hypothetical protein TRIATDRAFT_86496 [Trichoderma atroviride IMI 206040]
MNRGAAAQEGEKARTATACQRTVSPQENHELATADARMPRDRVTRPSDHQRVDLQPGTDTASQETDIATRKASGYLLLKFEGHRAPSVEHLRVMDGASITRRRGNPAPTRHVRPELGDWTTASSYPIPVKPGADISELIQHPIGLSRRDRMAMDGILDLLK